MSRLHQPGVRAWIRIAFVLGLVSDAFAGVLSIDGLTMALSDAGGRPLAETGGLRIFSPKAVGALGHRLASKGPVQRTGPLNDFPGNRYGYVRPW